MYFRCEQFYLKSMEADGLTYYFNVSKKIDIFPDCFARLTRLFCLQRNVPQALHEIQGV